MIEDLTASLETGARLAADALPDDPSQQQAWAESVFEVAGYRTTLIDGEGSVLADSHTDPASMDNHADRSEVIDAMGGQVGSATRVRASSTRRSTTSASCNETTA